MPPSESIAPCRAYHKPSECCENAAREPCRPSQASYAHAVCVTVKFTKTVDPRSHRHLRHFLPRRVLFTIVQGLVISRVQYCISVYGNNTAANCDRLPKVINFATRVVTGLKKYDHVSHARCNLVLRTPRQMCDMYTAVVAHKARVTGEPADLASLLNTYAALAIQ